MVFYGLPPCSVCGALPFSEPPCVCLHFTRWRNVREAGVNMEGYWALNDDKGLQQEYLQREWDRVAGREPSPENAVEPADTF